jgi:hypothetical protein
MAQLTHIHYMIKYFIKFNNHLNNFWNINLHFVVYCYKYYILIILIFFNFYFLNFELLYLKYKLYKIFKNIGLVEVQTHTTLKNNIFNNIFCSL